MRNLFLRNMQRFSWKNHGFGTLLFPWFICPTENFQMEKLQVLRFDLEIANQANE